MTPATDSTSWSAHAKRPKGPLAASGEHAASDVDAWIDETLVPRLALERRTAHELRARRAAAKPTLRAKLGWVLTGIGCAALLRSSDLFVAAFCLPAAVGWLRRLRVRGSSCDLRAAFLEPLVQRFGPSFECLPGAAQDRAELDLTRLFFEDSDQVVGGDRVSGIVGETPFRLQVFELRARDAGAAPPAGPRPEPASEPVYRGAWLEIGAHEDSTGTVHVLPRRNEDLLERFQRSLMTLPSDARGVPVQLGDAAFEERFAVRATDREAARRRLSPATRQRLLELAASSSGELRAVFAPDRTTLAFAIERAFLRVPASVHELSPEALRAWADDLRRVTDLVADLAGNLHARAKSA